MVAGRRGRVKCDNSTKMVYSCARFSVLWRRHLTGKLRGLPRQGHHMGSTPKTVEELQRQIDAQREQNIAWVSNIAVVVKRLDDRLEGHEAMLRELRDIQRNQDKLLGSVSV